MISNFKEPLSNITHLPNEKDRQSRKDSLFRSICRPQSNKPSVSDRQKKTIVDVLRDKCGGT